MKMNEKLWFIVAYKIKFSPIMLLQQYKASHYFMSYLYDIDYPADVTFLQEWLTEITPTNITQYFLFWLYRIADISLDNNKEPKLCCITML